MRLATLAVVVTAVVLGASGVARAAAPGTLDSSFAGGVVTLGGGTQLFGVAVQGDGSPVAAGQSGGAALVERLTAAGQPDPSFGSGGQVTGPSGSARAVALQSDGKIVVAGGGPGMFVERLNADGARDTGFGSGGVAVAGPLGGSAVGNAVAVQPDGKIVVAGSVVPSDPSRGTLIALARFNANGSLDSSFGSGGAEVLDFGLPFAVAQGLAIQPDGQIVFAGHEQGSPTYAFFNGLVGRLNSNGSLDLSFAGSGVVTYHQPGGGYTALNAVALQIDGKIVAAGADAGGPYAVFLRLNSDGTLDSSFGSGGVATLSSGTFTSTPVGANGVGIAGGGRVVGAGAVQLNGTDFRAGLWATSAAGAPDASFGSGGIVERQTGVEACALAIAPDGSLVTVGDSVSPSRPQSTLPCTVNSTSSAFVARYVGYGPAPVAQRPSVTTGASSAITDVSATVFGQVDPNGAATSYHFDFGTTTAYGSSTPSVSAGSGTAAVGVSATLTGLSPGTTYHYRIEATDSAGTTTGTDASFTTARSGPPTAAPTVTTGGASPITEVSAGVRGQVDSNGLATTYQADYGRTTAYGSSTPAATAGSGTSLVGVLARLKGLHAGTTYHYRLVASNGDGTSHGGDRTFRTLPRLRLRSARLSGSYRIATIQKLGLGVAAHCDQPCSIHGLLVIPLASVKALGLGKHEIVIGSGSARRRSVGTVHLRLRLTRKGSQLLSGFKQLSVTLQLSATPISGGPAARTSSRLTFKR
jgi:uncharacterized delta-60 repeat protein